MINFPRTFRIHILLFDRVFFVIIAVTFIIGFSIDSSRFSNISNSKHVIRFKFNYLFIIWTRNPNTCSVDDLLKIVPFDHRVWINIRFLYYTYGKTLRESRGWISSFIWHCIPLFFENVTFTCPWPMNFEADVSFSKWPLKYMSQQPLKVLLAGPHNEHALLRKKYTHNTSQMRARCAESKDVKRMFTKCLSV